MPSVLVGLECRQTRLISREGWRVQPDWGRGWLSVRLSVTSTGACRGGYSTRLFYPKLTKHKSNGGTLSPDLYSPTMRIVMGIVCQHCGGVSLITSRGNNRIGPYPRVRERDMFVVACTCGRKQGFHKNDLKPYEVSEAACALGFDAPGKYIKGQARYVRRSGAA
jgi:hypothetical protein